MLSTHIHTSLTKSREKKNTHNYLQPLRMLAIEYTLYIFFFCQYFLYVLVDEFDAYYVSLLVTLLHPTTLNEKKMCWTFHRGSRLNYFSSEPHESDLFNSGRIHIFCSLCSEFREFGKNIENLVRQRHYYNVNVIQQTIYI